jgi:hypothetical protein
VSHLRRGLVSLNSRHQFVSEIALMLEHAKAGVNEAVTKLADGARDSAVHFQKETSHD